MEIKTEYDIGDEVYSFKMTKMVKGKIVGLQADEQKIYYVMQMPNGQLEKYDVEHVGKDFKDVQETAAKAAKTEAENFAQAILKQKEEDFLPKEEETSKDA